MPELSTEERDYYARHFTLPGFREAQQLSLQHARVLVIGCGGLGASCLLYLAGAGVGHIGIMDADTVSVSNLPRQVLFDYKCIGRLKVEAARDRLMALNPFIGVAIYPEMLSRRNAGPLLSQYDVVINCTDNFDTKYLINDTCAALKKPLVWSATYQFEGQLSVFHVENDEGIRCSYRDLYPAPPAFSLRENCSAGGVLNVLPGVLGTLQASETIKLITGVGTVLSGKVLTLDAAGNQMALLTLRPGRRLHVSPRAESFDEVPEIGVREAWFMLTSRSDRVLLDVREQHERGLVSPGSRHIPLQALTSRVAELPTGCAIICYCQSGKRSQWAGQFLRDQGFAEVYSLAGCIRSLSEEDVAGFTAAETACP